MKKVDYLIVGYGIASACFAKKCLENGKSFHIISDFEDSASHVAAGLFNPVVLHRFNPVHRAEIQMQKLLKVFSKFEVMLDVKIVHKYPVYRIFAQENEAEIWQQKIEENPVLQQLLNPEIKYDSFENIHAPYGYGEVFHTGWIDMKILMKNFAKLVQDKIEKEKFEFELLDVDQGNYKNIYFDNIIFAEGIKVKDNPYFNYIPIVANKGETLIIRTEEKLPEIIFKSKNFLMPLGNNRYYVGATYDREWSTTAPTDENRLKLTAALESYFKGTYEIEEHRAALRPVSADRRGIIGRHPEFQNLYILNGMGTRGTFHAPDLSEMLFNYIESNTAPEPEYNVDRWRKRWLKYKNG